MKERTDKLELIEIKKLEKIFVNNKYNKWLLFNVHKEHSTIWKWTIQFKKWAKDLNSHLTNYIQIGKQEKMFYIEYH